MVEREGKSRRRETVAAAYVMTVILNELARWMNAKLDDPHRIRFTKVRAVNDCWLSFKAYDSGQKRRTIIRFEKPMMSLVGWGDNAEWFLYDVEYNLCGRYGLDFREFRGHLLEFGLMKARD